MLIDYSKLNYKFSKKPLLIGGKAMEYYGLRKAGDDIDFIVEREDLANLIKMYPSKLKNLWGDLGLAVFNFEIWKTIAYFDYEFSSEDAIEEENYLVISLEKLLVQKAIAMSKPKYHKDLELVVKRITDDQYSRYKEMMTENEIIIKDVPNVSYLEKILPE